MDGRTDNVKTVYPTTNRVCKGYNNYILVIAQAENVLNAGLHLFQMATAIDNRYSLAVI